MNDAYNEYQKAADLESTSVQACVDYSSWKSLSNIPLAKSTAASLKLLLFFNCHTKLLGETCHTKQYLIYCILTAGLKLQ